MCLGETDALGIDQHRGGLRKSNFRKSFFRITVKIDYFLKCFLYEVFSFSLTTSEFSTD